MNGPTRSTRLSRTLLLMSALSGVMLLTPTLASAQHYTQTNLVTSTTDADLRNPWGLSRSTGSPWWVSDNATGLSTIYSYVNGTSITTDGVTTAIPPSLQKVGLVVTVPPPTGSPKGTLSTPTGQVFNGSPTDFLIAGKGVTASASFLFCTEDGTVSGWSGGTGAVLMVDNSAQGAVYKGCTTADINGVRYLYVANFQSGKIEVYDSSFHRVIRGGGRSEEDRGESGEEAFDDDRLPRGFAPFNIQNIGGSLFVTFAMQDAQRHDDVPGAGLGYVDAFTPSGRLERRFEHGSWLNAPWGVVWSPRDFGEFSNRILVGNFGSGEIAAYDGFSGKFVGLMKTYADPVKLTGESVVKIDGLWALTFGNSATGCPPTAPTGSGLPRCGSAGPYNALFFTAGPNEERDGVIGVLTAIAAEQDGDEE
jgi:uncharacterized protein (TIGR03118 family)